VRTRPLFYYAVLLVGFGLHAPLSVQADERLSPATQAHPVLEDRYPARRTHFPAGVVGLADVTYAVIPGFRPLRLDLYLAPGATNKPHPLVIFVHGGGWQSGHTRHSGAFADWPGVLASLAARGYVVASVEYRLSGEAHFPAAIQDVKSAIRYLRAHSSEYRIDPARAVIWGGSAGGQLAALAATSCGVVDLEPAQTAPPPGARIPTAQPSASDCVQGLIAWYGVFDFTTLARQSAAVGGREGDGANSPPNRYLGCTSSDCETVEKAASAASYVDSKDPPTLLIHGSDDHTVPTQQSRDFLALLRSKGVPAELVVIPGVDHSFIGKTPQATRAASLEALQRSFEFIDKTIGDARPPSQQ